MRKILLIAAILFSTASFSQVFIDGARGGGVSPSGSFAAYYGIFLQGGTKVVYDTTARNAIASYLRDTSTLLVLTKTDSAMWVLVGGIANSNWVKAGYIKSTGSGGGSVAWVDITGKPTVFPTNWANLGTGQDSTQARWDSTTVKNTFAYKDGSNATNGSIWPIDITGNAITWASLGYDGTENDGGLDKILGHSFLDGKVHWYNGTSLGGILGLSDYVKYADSLIKYVTPTQLSSINLSYVPYTGATKSLYMGAFDIKANSAKFGSDSSFVVSSSGNLDIYGTGKFAYWHNDDSHTYGRMYADGLKFYDSTAVSSITIDVNQMTRQVSGGGVFALQYPSKAGKIALIGDIHDSAAYYLKYTDSTAMLDAYNTAIENNIDSISSHNTRIIAETARATAAEVLKADKATTLTIGAGSALDISTSRNFPIDGITGVSSNGYIKRSATNTLTNVSSIPSTDITGTALVLSDSTKWVGHNRYNDTIFGNKVFRDNQNIFKAIPRQYLTNISDSTSAYIERDGENTRLIGHATQQSGSGNAISLTASQYASFSDAGLPTTGDMSVSMWVKATGASAGHLFRIGNFGLYSQNTGSSMILILDINGANGGTNSGNVFTSDGNTWVHVVLVKGGTGANAIYINGVQRSTATGVGWTASYSGTSYIGHSGAGGITNPGTIAGQYDQFIIYNKALSVTEANQIYNGGTGTSTALPATANIIRRIDIESTFNSQTLLETSGVSGGPYNGTSVNTTPSSYGWVTGGKVPVTGTAIDAVMIEQVAAIGGGESPNTKVGYNLGRTTINATAFDFNYNGGTRVMYFNGSGMIIDSTGLVTQPNVTRAFQVNGSTYLNGAVTGGVFVSSSTMSSTGLLLRGSTSGTVSILPSAVAGTYNFNLPITAGTSGYYLRSGGGGSTAMDWMSPSAALAEAVTNYSDANQTIAALGFYKLAIASANRTLALPSPASFTGNTITVWNANNSGTFSWSWSTNAPVDAAGTTLTTIPNVSTIILKSNGSVWLAVSIN